MGGMCSSPGSTQGREGQGEGGVGKGEWGVCWLVI